MLGTNNMEAHLMSINGGDLKAPLIGREGDEEIGGAIPAAAAVASSKHSLGFGALVFLIYYNIGVPFGDEEVRVVGQDRYVRLSRHEYQKHHDSFSVFLWPGL